MKEIEFKNLSNYIESIAEEKESSVKNSEFDSLIPLVLRQYPGIKIRDFLDVDGTFSVVLPKESSFSLVKAVKLYTEIIDLIKLTTYQEYVETGFIEFDFVHGFWILFK